MADITIRPVLPPDIATVRSALVETWHATYDVLYGAERVREITARWHAADVLEAQAADPAAAFLLAERQGDVLASSFASPDIGEPGVVKLWRLYVRPRAQGAGIGARLMVETFACFPMARLHRLEVDPGNLPAIRFYERQGFGKVGETGDCGGGSAIRALVYARRGPTAA